MFTQKQDSHIHSYEKLGFIREIGTARKGRTINRIILTRACSCGREQAFECGDKEVMATLYKELAKPKQSVVS